MLTQRDMDAGMAAATKVWAGSQTSLTPPTPPILEKIVAAVILAVDAERSPVSITKDVLGAVFAPPLRSGS